MHAHQLLHLAGQLAVHADLLRSEASVSSVALTSYWTAAKCRDECWHRALTAFLMQRDEPGRISESPPWILPILEEILIAEPLARLWAAICDGLDAVHGDVAAGPLAKGVLQSHREVRQRVLTVMTDGLGLRMEEAVALNHLRLRCERWTDTLLALLGPRAARVQWAFHPRAVRRLAKSLWEQRGPSGNGPAALLLATLSAACSTAPNDPTPHGEFNRTIACSLLACFPPQVFDGTSQLISTRQWSLQFRVADVQARVRIAEPHPAPDAPDDVTLELKRRPR